MRWRAAVIATVALAAGCGRAGATKGGDTAAAMLPRATVDTTVIGDAMPPAATTGGRSESSANRAGSLPNGSGKAPSVAIEPPVTAQTRDPVAPAGPTSPAPGGTRPAGAMTPAFVIFRDSVLQSDLDWLRRQGFTIANVNDASNAVSVGVPDGYSGNPKANPRVARFTMLMR